MSHYTKKYIKNLTDNGLAEFLDTNKYELAGGAVFTKSSSLISRIISFGTRKRSKLKEFIPSHIGSIILLNDVLYIFNMVPPIANIKKLDEYLASTKDNFMIISRDFEFNIFEFGKNIINRVGQKYGYISAVQSVFKWWNYKGREHCSEIHTKELQKQGYLKDMEANETTPVGLYEKLLSTSFECKKEDREIIG